MDASQYDPQAVANAEAQIQHEMDRLKTGRAAAIDFQLHVHARVIANDVVKGEKPWHATVAEYRYLADLAASEWGLGPLAASAGRTA